MQIVRKIFLSLIVGFLLLCLVNMNHQLDVNSEIDNRKLYEFEYEGIPTLASNIDNYVKDRIGLRDDFINLYTLYNDRILNTMIHPTYTYGQDGYVFFKINQEIIDEEFIESFTQYLLKIQNYCNDRDVPFLYVLVPSKITVYESKLPKGYNYQNLFNQAIIKKLEEKDVRYINLDDILEESIDGQLVFNQKYDAGHWNNYGAYYGMNGILEELNHDFRNIKPHTFDNFEISTTKVTTLPVSNYKISEEIPVFKLLNNDIVNKTNDYQGLSFRYKNSFFNISSSNQTELPNLLFFHGSYFNSKYYLYTDRFNETYGIHNYQNIIDFDYYFNIFKPDCVIISSAEYATTRKYFDINAINSKEFNKPFSQVSKDIKEYSFIEYSQLDNAETIVNENSKIVQITFTTPINTNFGYAFYDGVEYDISFYEDKGNATIVAPEFDEDKLKFVFLK